MKSIYDTEVSFKHCYNDQEIELTAICDVEEIYGLEDPTYSGSPRDVYGGIGVEVIGLKDQNEKEIFSDSPIFQDVYRNLEKVTNEIKGLLTDGGI